MLPPNERNYHHQEPRADFPARNSPIYSSNRSTEHLRLSNLQNDRNFVQEVLDPSETSKPSPMYSPSRNDNSRIITNNNNIRGSPKSSPTHNQISSDTVAQNVINSPRHVSPSSTNNIGSPLRGQIQTPVTTGTPTTTESDPNIHGPRITSLPPGVTSGVAGPVFLNAGVPVLQRPSEPEPEERKSVSPPMKPSGKGLLPYNVIPPRPSVRNYNIKKLIYEN